MHVRTHIRAGGAATDNHQFGPVVERGSVIGWQFTISRSHPPRHVFSPPMSRERAQRGARAVLEGDLQQARAAWGGEVWGWLEGLAVGAREALLEGAREAVRS
jgi:hypothetical protein